MTNLAATLTADLAEQFRKLGCLETLFGLVTRSGTPMTIEPLSVQEARFICHVVRPRWRSVNKLRPRECYYNSQSVVLDDDYNRLEYCEGYFCSADVPFPISHAWLRINGKVVDLTARANKKTRQNDYLGITIPRPLLRRHLVATGVWSPVTEGPLVPELFEREGRPHDDSRNAALLI